MTDDRIATADSLVDDCDAALAAAGLDRVTCTTDPGRIPSGARHGVVVVEPPTLTFPTWSGDAEAVYEVCVIAGPADNRRAAWETIDPIINALAAGGIPIESAKPETYQPHRGEPLPCYTLTLNAI